MTPLRQLPDAKISALVSDVDGTLVNEEKVLTERARTAVAGLHARRIAFAIISSRPPRGLRMLYEPLAITTPIAGFNGGVLAMPDLTVIEQHLLSSAVARRAVDVIVTHGAEAWVFSGQEWLLRDPGRPYVDLEKRTVQFQPTVVADFGPALATANKIVAVSDDFDLLTRCEGELRGLLGDGATIARSQRYYVDITHKLANKGTAVVAIAKLLAIPMAEIAVIGDGGNDVAMFARSGFSIAMGNASAEVKKQARFVTASYRDEGFAKAVEHYVLGAGVERGAHH